MRAQVIRLDHRVYRMELQYDGTGLHGWAKQTGLSTVQGALEAALQTTLGLIPELRVAGRTDAGVHARRQVVSLGLPRDVDPARLRLSLNALTPEGIVVTKLSRATPGFDARTQALSRAYRYYVCTRPAAPPFWNGYCWRVYGHVDRSLLQTTAELVRGRHDFSAFTPVVTEHVFFERTVLKCAWRTTRADLAGVAPGSARGFGGLLYLEIEADAFLRHMVRGLVGTMFEVAQGKRTVGDFERLLDGAHRDDAGQTAPPHGLFLWDVRYPTR